MNTTKTEWPKILVEYADPKRKREIISLEDAVKRFNLDERSAGWLERGETAGTSVREPHVAMIHRYTLEDSIRDAAPDLLEALKGILGTWVTNGLCPFGKGRMLKCNCNYHAALDAARAAWNKAEGRQ